MLEKIHNNDSGAVINSVLLKYSILCTALLNSNVIHFGFSSFHFLSTDLCSVKMEFSRLLSISTSLFIVVFNFIPCFVESKQDDSVLVVAPFGKIKGLRKVDETTGQRYLSFHGIPYAKPPVNELRFAKPKPHPKLDGVFDATKQDRIECASGEIFRSKDYEDSWYREDCLILNIQMKDWGDENQLKKVMVFIHGGGYLLGSSYMYRANSFVIGQDVIMVTLNYRLGILGFLSTENEVSPGNYGLWDQALAIKWVKDNIQAFGGDPNDITISGESAGGSSVGYQSISPRTKGLFTKVMLQSGTGTSGFGQVFDAAKDAVMIAKFVGCWEGDQPQKKLDSEQSKVVIKCLRTVPLSKFTEFSDYSIIGMIAFRPRIDGDFIPDFPVKLIEDDTYLESIGFFDRSYLVALDNNEVGLCDFFTQQTKQMTYSKNNHLSNEDKELAWQTVKEDMRRIEASTRLKHTNSEANINVHKKINEFYSRRHDNYTALVELVNDLNMLIPSIDFLSACSRRDICNSYFLYFDHFPLFMKNHNKGIFHAMDLMYWFDIEVKQIVDFLKLDEEGEFRQDDFEVKKIFSTIIGDFTKSGYPGSSLGEFLPDGWPRFDPMTNYHVHVNTNPWVSSFFEKDKQEFWLKTIPNMLKPKHKHAEL